jgi:hypothetical protein
LPEPHNRVRFKKKQSLQETTMNLVIHACLALAATFGINHALVAQSETKVKIEQKSNIEQKAEQKHENKAPSFAASHVKAHAKGEIIVASESAPQTPPAAPSDEAPETKSKPAPQGLALGLTAGLHVKVKAEKKEHAEKEHKNEKAEKNEHAEDCND